MEVKKQRLMRLNDLISELSRKDNEKLRGKTVEVLVEGESKNNPEFLTGRTRTNKLVHFKGPKSLTGHFIDVTITEVQTWLFKGEIAAPQALEA